MSLKRKFSLLACCSLLLASSLAAAASDVGQRIKDMATLQGVRQNQLVGYGLIVGLDGTGDQPTQAPFTPASMQAMLDRLGIQLPPGTTIQPKNVAAVSLTANLPPFAKPGQATRKRRGCAESVLPAQGRGRSRRAA